MSSERVAHFAIGVACVVSGVAVALASCAPSSVTPAQHRANVERATDALCAVRATVKALEVGEAVGPRGDIERATDALCAARAQVKAFEASLDAGSAGAK